MPQTLFTNASLVLDGFTALQPGSDVLVKDSQIVSVSAEPIDHGDATIIDVGGRTLMPGLIDAHAHIMGLSLTPKNISYPAAELTVASANYLRNSLMDGFTTIREAGGADHATARLLAEGMIVGPRLFYSGKALTQTGGGADFRTPDEHVDPCGHVGPFSNMSVIADGIDEVRKAAREELRKGATQIKLFASGGVVFPAEGHSTLYEFAEEELRAVVEEAASRGTYVMAHVYTDEGVRRCLKAGVRSIEHANFVTEETMAMIGFGTDLWGPDAQKSQLREFEMRQDVDTPANILRSATVTNAELLMQKGKLGTLAEGAYADLLIVEGDPFADLGVLMNPQKNLKFIMKDGAVYKNELPA